MIDTIKSILIAVWTAWLGFIGALGTETANAPSLTPLPATEAIIEEHQATEQEKPMPFPMPTTTPTAILTIADGLKKYGVEASTAQIIDDAMTGKGRKMNYNEARQWLGAYNQAKTELKNNDLSSIIQKESVILQMNEIIKQGASKK